MNRQVLVGVMAATVLVLAIAPQAQGSRRSSLAGNLLIEDVNDIFFMPHEIVRYVNYVWFDFVTGVDLPTFDDGSLEGGSSGSSAPTGGAGDETSTPASIRNFEGGSSVGNLGPHLGSGGILFGNAVQQNFGFGIAVHRSDFQSAQLDAFGLGSVFHLHRNTGWEDTIIPDLGQISNLVDLPGFSQTPSSLQHPVQSINWIDLLAGFALSDQLTLGARISLGSSLFSRSDIDGPDAGLNDPGGSASSFNVVPSIGFDGDAFSIDGSVELTIASWDAEALEGDDELADSGSAFGLGVIGRAFFEMTDAIDLGALLSIYTRSRSTDIDDGSGSDDARLDVEISEFGLHVGAGPRYTIGEDAVVAAYATLGFGQVTIDPEGRNNVVDQVTVLLPAIKISGEFHLLEWLTYRAGLHSEYTIVSGEVQEDSDRGGDDYSGRVPTFYWANGLGFHALDGNFNLDAMLNWPIITQGPHLLSGMESAMFATVSASYTF